MCVCVGEQYKKDYQSSSNCQLINTVKAAAPPVGQLPSLQLKDKTFRIKIHSSSSTCSFLCADCGFEYVPYLYEVLVVERIVVWPFLTLSFC